MTYFGDLTMNDFLYCIALLGIFVDTLGNQFTAPVLVPYAQSMDIEVTKIGTLYTAQFIGKVVSNMVLPILADKKGRRLVCILSMAGSCVAYATQGLATELGTNADSKFMILLIGKVLSGLFGGTYPVMLAYIADLSIPDFELLKKRTTWAVTMDMSLPIVLSPIGGALSTLGLNLPFFFSSAVAMIGLVLSVIYMEDKHNPDEVAEKKKKKEAEREAAKAKDLEDNKAKEDGDDDNNGKIKTGGIVWFDPMLLLLGTGMFCFMFYAVGNQLMMPLLLEKESFGLSDADRDQMLARIATTMGLLQVASGVPQIFMGSFGYLWLSSKCADIYILSIGGSLGAMFIALISQASQVWHLALFYVGIGASFGAFMGAYMTMPNKYLGIRWPHDIAQGRAVYNIIGSFGQIVGPFPVTAIYEAIGASDTYLCMAIGPLIAVTCFTTFGTLMQKYTKDEDMKNELTTDWKANKKFIEEYGMDEFKDRVAASDARPVQEFLAQLDTRVRARLEEGNWMMHLGYMQRLVEKLIDRALPKLPKWEFHKKGNNAHMRELAKIRIELGDHSIVAAYERFTGADYSDLPGYVKWEDAQLQKQELEDADDNDSHREQGIKATSI